MKRPERALPTRMLQQDLTGRARAVTAPRSPALLTHVIVKGGDEAAECAYRLVRSEGDPNVRTAGLVTAWVALVACTGDGALVARRQIWDAQRRGLEEQLEQLEARLLADQARVHFWQQMRERHESVSAVACVNLGRHAESVALLDERQQEKRHALARKHRVASRHLPDKRSAQ